MEAVLKEAWLRGLDALPVRDDASVALVRERVRAAGAQAGLPQEAIERLVIAASELGHNILRHARDGAVAVRAIERAGTAGVEVVAADRGKGIHDPLRALMGAAAPSAGSLGAGLSGARRLTDEMDVDTRRGEGTCVRVRKFASLPTEATEVGIVGRPADGEVVSGDDAGVALTGGGLLMGVADGLGHGPEARVPSERAVEVVLASGERSLEEPEALLRACDGALAGTRGAVMSIVRLPFGGGDVVHAGSGNVSAALHDALGSRHFVSSRHVLGRDERAGWKPRPERLPLRAGCPAAILTVHTDGLSSRATLAGEQGLLRQHAVVIAQSLLERFGQSHDDALVLVCKHGRTGTGLDPRG